MVTSRVASAVAFSVVVCLVSLPTQAKYSGGTGEPNDPYQIATPEDLMLLGETPEDYDKHFILTADIDLDPNLPGRKVFDKAVLAPDTNDVHWDFDGTSFTGVLDGNGHMISHLTIVGDSYLGLFGALGESKAEAEVRKLGMVDANITGGDYVGSLAGESNNALVTQCYSTGSVSGNGYVGGLIGDKGGVMIQCYNTAAVAGNQTNEVIYGGIGGLVGENHGTMIHCYSIGSVRCDGQDCFRRGGSIAGGLVGKNAMLIDSWATVINCLWDLETSGQITSRGGTSKTTAEMQTAGTFLSWGTCGYEGGWMIDDGQDYPRLHWEKRPGELIKLAPLSDLLTGTGTEDDPFLIHNADELNLIGLFPCEWDKRFELMADIDMSGFDGKNGRPPFNIIAQGHVAGFEEMLEFRGTPFTGIFDGNSHKISHLTIKTKQCGGLFGGLGTEGEIRNLGIVDVNIIDSYFVGGLVGFSDEGSSVTQCYSTGMISGWYAGGLVGRNSGNINRSHSVVTVDGSGLRVGGLVGDNQGNIAKSYSAGTANGFDAIGGLVGVNGGNITTSYSIGNSSGNFCVGGLVGINRGSIATSYSTGMVNGHVDVGGLVGRNEWDSLVTHCFSTGLVIGEKCIGGLVGTVGESLSTVLHCVWDVENSGQTTSAGGVGLTTAEMMNPDMLGLNDFANDPNWILDTGHDYPRLTWEGTAGQTIPDPFIDWLIGHGIQEDPYRIDGADQLISLSRASILWDRHFILSADINLDPNLPERQVFSQAVIQVFSGVFDGNGNSISNLTMLGESYLGLFGKLTSGAIISNLGLKSIDINGSGLGIGGLAGSNSGTITTSFSTGIIQAQEGGSVGGLVGYNDDGNISSSYGTCTVFGDWWIGGLVGINRGNINSSYSTGSVSGDTGIGGFVGQINDGSINKSYSTGSVTGERWVGGFVGSHGAYGGDILQCVWDMETSGQAVSDGGIGKTTSEMQSLTTFFEIGWDFVDETANGIEDIWWILEGQDYPRLWWENK